MKCHISMSSLGLTAFVLFFSASCIPEFKNPLPVPKGVKPDLKILGTWEEAEPSDETFQVSFFPPTKSGHMYIVWINIEGPEYEPDISIWQGYTTIINKDKFLCLRFIRDVRQDLGNVREPVFLIAHYRITDEDTLLIYMFSQYSIRRMIEKGKLKGEIEERSYSDKVTVTSSSEELVAAIIKEGVESFISDDEGDYVGMKFKRLKK